MEPKKNPKSDIERYRSLFFLTGLAVSLLVSVLIFNIHKTNVKIEDLQANTSNNVEEEQVAITRQDVTPPPPPPPQQQVADMINFVSNDKKIQQTFDFNVEVDENTAISFDSLDLGTNEQEEEEPPLVWAEQMPEFPGGEEALRRYIAEHTKYPALAAENGIQGTVYVRFVVKKNGNVGEVQVTRGVDPLLDQEAIRVVKSLPKFKPGIQGGRPVNVWFSVPIYFKLNE